MEETSNLLDDFATKNTDLTEYRNSYNTIRKIARILFVFSLVISLLLRLPSQWDNTRAAYSAGRLIGSVIGTILAMGFMVAVPSALFASLLAAFVDTKYVYKERFQKFFWLFVLGMMALMLLIILFTIGNKINSLP